MQGKRAHAHSPPEVASEKTEPAPEVASEKMDAASEVRELKTRHAFSPNVSYAMWSCRLL